MKKAAFIALAILLLSFSSFAAEDKAEEVASQTLAGLNQQGKSELEKAVRKTDPAVIDQTSFENSVPKKVAADKKEVSDSALPADPAPSQEKVISQSAPQSVSAGAMVVEKPTPEKTRLPDIKASVMEANWDEIFSKKVMPADDVYTVQPGDSLYVLAARNHTTIDLIKKMNGLKNDKIYAGKKLRIYKGSFTILVDKSENVLILFADGKPVRRYHVSTGKKDSTPAGEFKIVSKLANPTWFKTGAIYPPGSPDNVLGTRWLGFDKPEYGIHGTTEPNKIGQSVSEGCVRMRNAEVEELYSMVPVGTVVTIEE